MFASVISDITQFYHLDPKFVVSLLNSLHVDDLNSEAHTTGEALEFFVKFKEGLALGGFNLSKFRSNSKELENLVVEKFHGEISNENTILSLQWDKSSDEIIYDVNKICKNIPTVITKRSIIQFLASIYDPLGLINPLIVKFKVLFQDMCIEKHNWDDQLSEKFVLRFTEIVDDFNNIDSIIFNRKYCFTSIDDPIVNIQLHGFSDASLRAYGCCVYLRIEHKSGIVKCDLVSAKSRVSPIKKQSIPRLELLAANLLTNLFVCVYDNLKNVYSFDEIYCWVDSSVVFAWINNVSKVYKLYVQSRLISIRNLVKPET